MDKVSTYQYSGEFSVPGLISAFLGGTIIAMLLGFAYNALLIAIPVVYINFFLTLGLGAALGYFSKYFARMFKLRNGKLILGLTAAIGFMAFYFQWIAYFVFLSSAEISFEAYRQNFDLFYRPGLFIELILELNQLGSWEIFGILFTGFPLWFIWAIEASFIIGIPILLILKTPIVPFSETLNCWYPKHILKYQFEHISAQNKFQEEIFANTLNTITGLNYGSAFRYSEVSIYYLKDAPHQYLSIENIFIPGKSNSKKQRSSLVHLLEITTEVADKLMAEFGAKKQSVLNY